MPGIAKACLLQEFRRLVRDAMMCLPLKSFDGEDDCQEIPFESCSHGARKARRRLKALGPTARASLLEGSANEALGSNEALNQARWGGWGVVWGVVWVRGLV